MSPSNDIDVERRNLLGLAILDRNKRGAFGAALADMATLKIAAECDMRPLVQNGGLVHMGQRPVIVSLVDKVLDGARRVVGMAPHAAESGVQDADVEATGRRGRISGDEVLRDIALPKALAVQCHGIVLQHECFRPPWRKHTDVRREDKAARDLAFGVMIAVEQEDRDPGLRETAHLRNEEKAGLIVPPVAVIEVTCNDDEYDLFFDRLADEIVERDTRRGANAFGSGTLLPGKSLERTIEMNVAGVNEAKRFQGETPLMQARGPTRFTGWLSHQVIEIGRAIEAAARRPNIDSRKYARCQ